MDKNVYDALRELMKRAATEDLERDSYKEICESVKVAKMYYDMDLGDSNRYVDPFTGQLVVAQRQKDDKIILYEQLQQKYQKHRNNDKPDQRKDDEALV